MAGSEIEDIKNEITLADSKIEYVLCGSYMFIDSHSNMYNVIATSGDIIPITNMFYGGLDFAYTIPVITNEGSLSKPDKLAIAVMRCYKNHLYYDPNWNGGKYMLLSSNDDKSIPLNDYWGFTSGSGRYFFGADLGSAE